jgi:hypothetical protein
MKKEGQAAFADFLKWRAATGNDMCDGPTGPYRGS